MSDETHSDTAANTAPEVEAVHTDAPAETLTAAERIREFEDRELGEDAVRINGRVERGFGSKFMTLSNEKHAHYLKLEKLAEAEQVLADAKANLVNAENAYNDALAAVDAPEAPHAGE